MTTKKVLLFLQITCLIYVIGSCDLVRRCIGPQGLIICKNLKNEKNQVRRFCTLVLDIRMHACMYVCMYACLYVRVCERTELCCVGLF